MGEPHGHPATIDARVEQLTQVQRVAVGQPAQPRVRRPEDLAGQGMPDKLVDHVAGQHRHHDGPGQLVLPQHADRVRDPVAVADREHHLDTPLGDQMVHERRRRLVEQVRVVDREQDRALFP
jgi:hypothetical protein